MNAANDSAFEKKCVVFKSKVLKFRNVKRYFEAIVTQFIMWKLLFGYRKHLFSDECKEKWF